jgi:hypothetical protein
MDSVEFPGLGSLHHSCRLGHRNHRPAGVRRTLNIISIATGQQEGIALTYFIVVASAVRHDEDAAE